jgi:hypothetical protein
MAKTGSTSSNRFGSNGMSVYGNNDDGGNEFDLSQLASMPLPSHRSIRNVTHDRADSSRENSSINFSQLFGNGNTDYQPQSQSMSMDASALLGASGRGRKAVDDGADSNDEDSLAEH